MSDPTALAHAFLAALTSRDSVCYEQVLADDAALRMWRWDGAEAYRPRTRVVGRLIGEWSGWADAVLEPLGVVADGERVALEFRIQATENQRYVEHNRSAFLTLRDGRVQVIDMYCPEPLPSARRKGWVAPAAMADEEIERLFESYQYTFDIREWVPPEIAGKLSLRRFRNESGDPHPGSNAVAGVHWTAEEADRRIDAMIAYHRERNLGFRWLVGPYDTPLDLPERLERHGMVLAGDQIMMARVGLDRLDIPTNPSLTIEVLDGSDDQTIEDVLRIVGRCFNWTPEQIDERRPGFFERIKSPSFREQDVEYLARLGGVPVADAMLSFRAGTAYLAGAATLPEYRGQKVYSTLLRRRLEDARARGYHLAAIHAEPMSRRVVRRYGFKEYARFQIYAWMPSIDMAVIRGLVPDE